MGDIVLDLLDEGFLGREVDFIAQATQKMEVERFAVEGFVQIEKVSFKDGFLNLRIGECGTVSKVGDASNPALRGSFFAKCLDDIDSRGRENFSGWMKIGSRESQGMPDATTLNNGFTEGVGMPQHGGCEGEVATLNGMTNR